MGAAELTSTAADPSSGGRLLRVLGLSFALAIGVGSVIGGGILRLPASVADAVGGVEIALLLWAAVAVHSFIQANVIAEVMAALPKAGGLFVPARAAFGEPEGLLIGWVSKPCASTNSDDIIVCGRRDINRRYRLPQLDTDRFEPNRRAETLVM